MKEYVLTVFAKDGEKLLDESFQAENDEAAKEMGQKKISDNNFEDHTYRCVSPLAKLVLFNR